MRELKTTIDTLSQKIETMQKQAQSSAKITVVGYALIVIFVFAYTFLLMKWIEKEVTANNLSAQMKLMINDSVLTEQNRKKVVQYCRDQAPVWADGLVQMTHDQFIPMIKMKVKSIIDSTTDSGIVKLKRDLFPEVKRLMEVSATELSKHKDITDAAIAKEVTKILANEAEREMDVIINSKVKSRIANLKIQLDKMSDLSYDKLTQKEAAKRKIIVNWVYLMEHGEAPSDMFGEFMKSINSTYEGTMKSLNLSK